MLPPIPIVTEPIHLRNVAPIADPWPDLERPGWLETVKSLTLWAQLLGKTRIAHCPPMNHWWHAPFYVSARGLSTSPIPIDDRVIDLELDFVGHRLTGRASDGAVAELALAEQPLSSFYAGYAELLARLGVALEIYPYAVEVPERIRLDQDHRLCRYDPIWVSRFFQALLQADRLLKAFRGRFIGKASPVHFFWGAFDLAATRFSGRPAPAHPGGIPNVGDWVMRESYSHEVSSAGFWPGDARFPEAAFYAYAYPEPPGFSAHSVRPAAATYVGALGEFVLPYRAVRTADDPDGEVMAFLESSYAAAADLAHWDRGALERHAEMVRYPESPTLFTH
jgi:hypothetical protein